MGGAGRRLLGALLVVALVEVAPSGASAAVSQPPPTKDTTKHATGADTAVLPSPLAADLVVDGAEPGVLTDPPGDVPGPRAEQPVPDLAVELEGERTASSQTFRNSDGTETTRYFDERQFFERGGVWVPIDNSVVADASRPGCS